MPIWFTRPEVTCTYENLQAHCSLQMLSIFVYLVPLNGNIFADQTDSFIATYEVEEARRYYTNIVW